MIKAIFAIALSAATVAQAAPSLSPYIGKWKVVRIIGSGAVTMSNREASKALGKTLSISTRAMMLPGASCSQVTSPTLSTRTTDDVLADEQMNRRDLTLPGDRLTNAVTFIDGKCVSAIPTAKGNLVVFGAAGYAYLAVKERRRRY